MNFKSFYQTLEKVPYPLFSLEDIFLFYPKEKRENLTKLLYRWKKRGWITSLKRGLYELSYPREKVIPDLYVGNRLYSPSYISLETALSHYSLIPQVAMAVTSITTKPTRTFRNRHGLFTYRTVKPEAFTGYFVDQQGAFPILMADPEKALVDYIYFKTLRKKSVDFSEERFDKKLISKLHPKKLNAYAKLYRLNLEEFYAHL